MSRSTNFKCPNTGEEFLFTHFTIIPKGNGVYVYKEKGTGKEIVHPVSGVPLECLDAENPGIGMVMGSIADQKIRNSEYFKDRAKKHANSEEQKYLKKQRMNQEFKLQ